MSKIGTFREWLRESELNEAKITIDYDYLLENANKNTSANVNWKISKDGTYKLKDFFKIQTDTSVKSSFGQSNSSVLISCDLSEPEPVFTITEYVDKEERSYTYKEKNPKLFWKYVKNYFKGK